MKKRRKNSLGYKIARIRMEADLSQAELSEIIGADQTRISFWESGKQYPSRKSMLALIKLGKQYDVFFNIEDLVNSDKE